VRGPAMPHRGSRGYNFAGGYSYNFAGGGYKYKNVRGNYTSSGGLMSPKPEARSLDPPRSRAELLTINYDPALVYRFKKKTLIREFNNPDYWEASVRYKSEVL